jgi:hypothetical protein
LTILTSTIRGNARGITTPYEVLLSRKSRRGKRRPVTNSQTAATPDRYQKYLPTWMKDGTAPPRPPRPRRARPARPAGGYTPGKLALGDVNPLG